MTKQKRRRRKRSSSDILDEFIDDSLRIDSGDVEKKRRPVSSSRKRKRSSSGESKKSPDFSGKQHAPHVAVEQPKKKKVSHMPPSDHGEKLRRRDIIEDPADELLNREGRAKHTRIKTMTDLVIGILIACVFIALLIFYIKFDRAEVISGSMEPTLMTNEKVVIMNSRSPKQFNLVVFYPPTKGQDKYVKRIIGLPGDKIAYKDDILYINDEMYDEPYLKSNKKKFAKKHPGEQYTEDLTVENIPGVDQGVTEIPADMYFVLGDNRQNSQDSRFIGLIPKSNLVGVVWKKAPMPQKIKP